MSSFSSWIMNLFNNSFTVDDCLLDIWFLCWNFETGRVSCRQLLKTSSSQWYLSLEKQLIFIFLSLAITQFWAQNFLDNLTWTAWKCQIFLLNLRSPNKNFVTAGLSVEFVYVSYWRSLNLGVWWDKTKLKTFKTRFTKMKLIKMEARLCTTRKLCKHLEGRQHTVTRMFRYLESL